VRLYFSFAAAGERLSGNVVR